jgi:sugar transferase (PEP-CTERM system associated)
MKTKRINYILLISDIFAILAAYFSAVFLRIGNPVNITLDTKFIISFIFLCIIVLISNYIFGLYDSVIIAFNFDSLILYSFSFIFIIIAGIIIFYIKPFVIGRRVFLYFLLYLSLLSTALRLLIFKIAYSILLRQNILFFGTEKECKELSKILSRYNEYDLVGVTKNKGLNADDFILNKSNTDKLFREKLEKADIIVIGDYRIDKELARELIEKRLNGKRIFDFSSFYEMLAQKVPIKLLDDEWFLICPGFEKVGDGFYSKVKRIVDVAVSTILLIISSPIFLIIPIIIKISSRGPIFYVQERCGLDEKRFKLMKFRTMVNNAEENGPQWASENDPRVTRVGKILRKLRLDELPQLINVLKGDMSLIGPRPERDYFIRELKAKIPYYSLRFYVKPGITGWAQINYRYGASLEDAIEKLAYDLYYIKNMSFLLDISIILKTIRVVLLGHGAR